MSSSANRPGGVTAIALLWTVWAVLLFTAAAEMWHGRVGGYVIPQFPSKELTERAPYVGIFGVVSLVVGFGLWAMQNWARILTLCCCFAILAMAGWNLYWLLTLPVRGASLAIWISLAQIAISGLPALYLVRRDVVKAFHEAW